MAEPTIDRWIVRFFVRKNTHASEIDVDIGFRATNACEKIQTA